MSGEATPCRRVGAVGSTLPQAGPESAHDQQRQGTVLDVHVGPDNLTNVEIDVACDNYQVPGFSEPSEKPTSCCLRVRGLRVERAACDAPFSGRRGALAAASYAA